MGLAFDPFKHLLNLGLLELGMEVVDELTRGFLLPFLSAEEADRVVGWHLGVRL